MDNHNSTGPSLWVRLHLALACFWRAVTSPAFSRRLAPLLEPAPEPERPPAVLPPERAHASGLLMLSLLQREGRLIDFLQEDVAAFGDADIGAAARVVHAGCRQVLAQCLALEPVLKDQEGAMVTLPSGFDAQRIRLAGKVTGQPPFRGTLKHHGWVVTAVRLPSMAESLDPRVLAPAEVEL